MNKIHISLGVIAILVLLVVGGLLVGKNQPVDIDKIVVKVPEKVNETLGGVTRFPNGNPVEVETLAYESATSTGAQRLVTGAVSMELPSGADNVFWNNNTGRDVDIYAADLIIPFGQVASSSQWISVLATTTTALGNQFDYDASAITIAQGGDTFLFHAILVATSSTASSTSSSWNSSIIDGTSKPSLLVPSGRNVVMYLESAQAVLCRTSGQCGTATATDRGINPVVRFFYTSTTTSSIGR